MNVILPPEQLKWLHEQVTAGHYVSIDEALSVAVADLMGIHSSDLAWAKPYVDQARASLARGDIMSGADYFKRLNDKLDELHAT